MPTVVFTSNLQRHVDCPSAQVDGSTVREALTAVFETNANLRGYIVDEHGRLRRHMAVFVDGDPIRDPERLSDQVQPNSEIYVMQALSGG